MTTEERLKKLEEELSELKNRVRTKRVEILDEEGRAAAFLITSNGLPIFRMMSRRGRPQITMTLTETGPIISLNDVDGTTRAEIMASDERGPGMSLYDAAGNLRMGMLVSEKGPSGLIQYDANGQIRVVLALGKDGKSKLGLFDTNAEPIHSWSTS